MHELSPEQARLLAQKYLDGTITPKEKQLFDSWYQSAPDTLEWDDAAITSEEVLQQRMLQQIEAGMPRPAVTPLYKRLAPVAAIAAAIAGIAVLSILWWRQPAHKAPAAPMATVQHDRPPGKSGAILTLADGSTVALDEAQQGQVATQGAIHIQNQKGRLSYTGGKTNSEATAMNTITTPVSRQYQLVLAEGTKVWLNASSSLRFPAAFNGKERIVELTGEAYFEVAASVHAPFTVKVNGIDIQVLGTRFNVNAYAEEEAVKTTLVQGAVKVEKGAVQQLLSPGEQAAIAGDKVKITHPDIEAVTGWVNGSFVFKKTDIKTAMSQIARWYDLDVTYKGDMTGITLSGDISRDVYASSLLKALELTGTVRFNIEGRNITVMPH